MTQPHFDKFSIFMPAYNAQRHIQEVISRLPQNCWTSLQSLWIINDGSTDDSATVIKTLEKKSPKIKAVHFKQNRGYGAVVKKGLKLCRDDDCQTAICLHSDGQYPPEYIPYGLELMKTNQYDVLQGSRIASGTALSGGMPVYKFLANRLLTFLENRVYGIRMTDYHSGFLFYSRKVLEQIPFEKLSGSFDIDLEIIVCSRTKGLNIGEFPIPTRYADEISHLNPINYGFRCLKIMSKYLKGDYRT